jgi:hypothetical protein
MMQEAARPTSPTQRSRAVRLPVLTVVMTFAIAVAAEAFSPMPVGEKLAQGVQDCTPALTIGLTAAGKANTGTWLQLVKNDGTALCAVRQ